MHNVPSSVVEPLLRGPSPRKITQVAQLQNDIQTLLGSTHHTFLQGSYKNNTAPSDINDVDIVAVRRTTYSGVHSPQRNNQHDRIAWDSIFSELEILLDGHPEYDWTVERGDKCIKLTGPFNVDVIPAVVYSTHDEDPIVVYSMRDGREIVNHPRTHYENGVEKHASTGELYKPTVRMFKNWKQNHYGQDKSMVSSFKIEALVNAVDDAEFVEDPVARFILVGASILELMNMRSLVPTRIMSVCGNEDITEHWDLGARRQFVAQLSESVNHARLAFSAPTAAVATQHWNNAFNVY
ncbi:MAG: nucleotidyltransferase [Candidatus Paceibacterota bacterium]